MPIPPTTENPTLQAYLKQVRPHLPLRESHDILMELESTILDRVDTLASREERDPDEELLERALEELGEPEKVAAAYGQERYLVAPEAFRPFVLYTCMFFVLHMVLVGVATALSKPLHFGLFPILPVGPHGLLSVLASAVQALLLDIGVMVIAFGAVGIFRRGARPPKSSFAVQASPRQAGGRVALAALTLIVLLAFRDKLFVVVGGGLPYPLTTDWATQAMPYIGVLFGVSIVKDSLYIFLGERKTTVAIDAFHGCLALIVCLYLIGGDALLQVPDVPGVDGFRAAINAFLDQLGTLVLSAVALLCAAKTLRRCVRMAQI